MNLVNEDATQFIFSDLFESSDVQHLPLHMRSMVIPRSQDLSPYVPSINPHYSFQYSDGLRKAIEYLMHGEGQSPWFFGPQGCGKTSVVAQLAAWFNRSLRQVYVSDTTESDDLLFGYLPDAKGSLKLRHFALATAMENGYWLLINEFDQLSTSQQKYLNQIFEERVAELPNGQRIVAHPDFRLIVSANTNGAGDMTGNFGNVAASDASVPDRFFSVECDYLPKEKEKELLFNSLCERLKYYGISKDMEDLRVWNFTASVMRNQIVDSIVDYANVIRASYKAWQEGNEGYQFTISQRSTIEWACQSAVDFLWETDKQDGVYNSFVKGMEHAFVKGLRSDLQAGARSTLAEKIGKELKRAA